MLNTNYDVSKIFIWNNRYNRASYTNSGEDPVTLPKGTVLGRVTTGGKVKPFTSGASDGSQQPVGILADDYIVAPSATVIIMFCDGGDVAEEKLIFQGGDSLTTVVTGQGIVRDLIGKNTTIKLVAGTELTGFDNQ